MPRSGRPGRLSSPSARKGWEVLVDPSWLTEPPRGESISAVKAIRSSSFSDYATVEDEYFAEDPEDSGLGEILDEMVEDLPEDERLCVQMRVFECATFDEIAREHGWFLKSGVTNRKRAWRVTQRGLARLRTTIQKGGWV